MNKFVCKPKTKTTIETNNNQKLIERISPFGAFEKFTALQK